MSQANEVQKDSPLSFGDGNILLRHRHGRHTGSCEYLGLWKLQRSGTNKQDGKSYNWKDKSRQELKTEPTINWWKHAEINNNTHILIPVLSAPLLCDSPPGTYEFTRNRSTRSQRKSKELKESLREKWRWVYQEQSQTWRVGNLFPLLQSIPSLETKRGEESKAELMRKNNYPLHIFQPLFTNLGIIQYIWDLGISKKSGCC